MARCVNDSLDDDSDTASVTVNCYELTVTKDATTTYSRDYDWDPAKTRFIADGENDGDDDPLTLTLSLQGRGGYCCEQIINERLALEVIAAEGEQFFELVNHQQGMR